MKTLLAIGLSVVAFGGAMSASAQSTPDDDAEAAAQTDAAVTPIRQAVDAVEALLGPTPDDDADDPSPTEVETTAAPGPEPVNRDDGAADPAVTTEPTTEGLIAPSSDAANVAEDETPASDETAADEAPADEDVEDAASNDANAETETTPPPATTGSVGIPPSTASTAAPAVRRPPVAAADATPTRTLPGELRTIITPLAAGETPPPPTVTPVSPRPPSTGSRPQQAALMLELQSATEGGRIAVSIYRDAASFAARRGAVRSLMAERTSPVTRAWVLGLPPGRYAIAAFHDLDGDGRRATDGEAAEREAQGFSNGAGKSGAVSFDAAAFTLTEAGVTQVIRLDEPATN